ncbi:hypothetical protein ABZ769_14610 [Streptomyces olivoreticuli]
MDGQRKATAWCGRLLLFAALLLGIVTMHTLGHPTGHGESRGTASHAMSHAAGASAHAIADSADSAGVPGAAHGLRSPDGMADFPGAATADGTVAHPQAGPSALAAHAMTGARGHAVHTVEPASDSSVAAGAPSVRGDGRHGMDPMSVCLAVLGAALLLAVARRGRTVPAVDKVRTRLLRVGLWPIPPPPRHKALARLSVLRV